MTPYHLSTGDPSRVLRGLSDLLHPFVDTGISTTAEEVGRDGPRPQVGNLRSHHREGSRSRDGSKGPTSGRASSSWTVS